MLQKIQALNLNKRCNAEKIQVSKPWDLRLGILEILTIFGIVGLFEPCDAQNNQCSKTTEFQNAGIFGQEIWKSAKGFEFLKFVHDSAW